MIDCISHKNVLIYIETCTCDESQKYIDKKLKKYVTQYNLFANETGRLTISCPFCGKILKYFIK